MDFVKSQFDRIQRQLNGLSASQKMLTAALLAIMVMTLMMWGRYAGEAEFVPVLDQSFAQDELSRIVTELAAKGITHKTDGTRILVPEDRRIEALAHLSYGQMLPRDFANGFDEVSKSISPFESSSVTEAKMNRGKEQTLAAIIGGFPNVKNAVVMIDANAKRRLGGSGNVEPSATISIYMRNGGQPPQQLINAAADVVAGAQAGLHMSKIKVSVDGMPRKVQGASEDGAPGGDEVLALMKNHESYLENRIREFLNIPNVMVLVAVDLSNEKKETSRSSYDPEKSVKVLSEETERTMETTSALPPSGEPGAQSNTGMDINTGAAAGAGGSTVETETKTKMENKIATLVEKIYTPAGMATPVGATIRVPRSYFVSVLKSQRPDVKEPDEQAIEALAAKEMPKIKEAVRLCTKLKSKDAVSVETYLDLATPQFVGDGPETATASSVSFLVGGHAKEIALGALAAISLFMVSMMVRRSAPMPVMAAPAMADRAPTQLDAGEMIAGEVGGGDAMLDGMELDDDAIKTQQMLDQVSTLVDENPDAAAALVKRWMNRN